MGPKQTKTGLISKPKISKRHLYVKVFRISGIFKEYPSQRQPTDKSRDRMTVENRPKTALKKFQHCPRQDQAGQDRPCTAQHKPNTGTHRLTFMVKNFIYSYVFVFQVVGFAMGFTSKYIGLG